MIKSDNIANHTKVDETIIQGKNSSDTNILESFNVLPKEMQSLDLRIDLKNSRATSSLK
ncbi:hypothetical protein [Candidatus Liberibacter sp.]|uniref:hypothetical protein n=1 Tax=Candidatus Liberibacter sp. TaxID=34022 RepID=UPI0015F51B66|nr:hypothetical protein [Candidatus Liberibacter sp.]MBA5723673.1 hypothetical protein [Candidatus Liberibacter sp.]